MTFSSKCLEGLSLGDKRTYMQGGFIKAITPRSKEFAFYYVSEINESARDTIFCLKDEDANSERCKRFKQVDLHFDFSFPQRGFYSLHGEAIHYAQLPKRQSLKVLNGESHKLFHVLSGDLGWVSDRFLANRQLAGYQLWTCPLLNELFLQTDARPIKAKINAILKEKLLSSKLNINFAISVGINSHLPSIWFRNHHIGELLSPQRIAIAEPLFFQEAVDFFTPHKIDVIHA